MRSQVQADTPPQAELVNEAHASDRVMLDAEVREKTGLSHTTRWREVKEGRFPAPLTISKGRIGWLASEVEQWLKQRIEARNARKSQVA